VRIFSFRSSFDQVGRCIAFGRWTVHWMSSSWEAPSVISKNLSRTPLGTPWQRQPAPARPRLRVSTISIQPASG
jgi:hypothetical protein